MQESPSFLLLVLMKKKKLKKQKEFSIPLGVEMLTNTMSHPKVQNSKFKTNFDHLQFKGGFLVMSLEAG